MRNLNRFIIGVLATITAVSGVVLPASAQSSELSPEKIEIIRDYCATAQSAIQRTQKSDLVARTNLGRSYEYILGLMASLNSRIALNKLSQPRMAEVTSELQSRFEAFHNTYTDYTVVGEQTLRIACEREPVKFYESLTAVRVKRSQLAADTTAMRQLIDEYAQRVDALQESIKQ